MAITVNPYNKFKVGQLNGDHFVDFNSHDFYLTLHQATYVPDFLGDDEFYDELTGELAAAGNYTVGGKLLTSTSVGVYASFAYFAAGDVTWSALTATFRYAVLRRDTGDPSTSPLILLIDFGVNQEPAGVDFIIQWAHYTEGGVLKLT